MLISIPSSVREGPRTTNTLAKKWYLIIYFLIITLSAQPAILWFWYFWQFFPELSNLFFMLFPIAFMIGMLILIFSSIIVSKLFLIVINAIHKPKEGVFPRDNNNKDYCFWSLRSVVKKWPAWLTRQLNIPLFEIILFKFLGVKLSKNNALQEGWVDIEFIEIGNNVKLGQGSLIMSNIIMADKLIIKKVIINDNVVIGAHSVVTPGTEIGKNTVLDAISMTKISQKLEENSIYSGLPARKIMNNGIIENEEYFIRKVEEIRVPKEEAVEKLEGEQTELSVPFHVYVSSGWWIVGGSYIVPAFLFLFFMYQVLLPNLLIVPFSLNYLLEIKTIILFLLTPIIFTGIYILHLLFVMLFTAMFYRIADYRGPAQGIFDRNLDEQSKALDYYHWRSFLLKYPVFAFIRSPFPWLLNWELNTIGSNNIGKGTVLEECYIHSHLHWGENCYVGTFSHISNHLVDGVYGEENLTFYGAIIGDNCIFSALIGGLPGLEMEGGSTFLPLTSSIKFDKFEKGDIYSGFPARKLTKEQIKDFTGGLIDE